MALFDIKIDPKSQKLIDNLAAAGQIDLRPTMDVIGIGYRKEVELIFEHQQPRNEDFQWAPLSVKYAAWKAIHYPGQPILVRTGALKASMTQLGAPGNITIITKTGAVFGSSISYGIYHDSDQPRSRLPRRNFSTPSDNRITIWQNQLQDAIVHNFQQNGIEVEEGSLFQ